MFFLEIYCFYYDPMDVGNLISSSSAFSNYNLYIWKFLVDILLKHSLKDFECCLASMWNEHNCMVFWTFFDIACLWDWNANWPFPVLRPLLSFLNLLAYWVYCFTSIILGFEIVQLKSCVHGIWKNAFLGFISSYEDGATIRISYNDNLSFHPKKTYNKSYCLLM